MRSFISSSRTVLLTAVLALLTYATVVALWRPTIRLYPDQDAFNLARAERILLGEEKPATLIVGSSLGVRIPDDWLPQGWLNLSLGGKGAATGLGLVAAAGPPVPQRVLVEINTLERPVDARFIAEAAGPLPLVLRRWVPGLRSEYRPINLFLSVMGGWSRGPNAPRAPGDLGEACRALKAGEMGDVVSRDVVDREVARAASQPAPSEIGSSLAALAPAIAALEAKGVEVVLFEWPIDAKLMQGVRAIAIRTAAIAAFPKNRFLSVEVAALDTEDGLHLAPLSARRAACVLGGAIERP